MHVQYLINHLEERAKEIEFPQYSADFDLFQRRLRTVLTENCNPSVARSLTYCYETQMFMVQVREACEIATPITGPESGPQLCNLIFECVQTINPRHPIAKQIEDINELSRCVNRRYDDLIEAFTKP